jgi:hypothetical protein
MNETHLLEAIDEALRLPSFCACGENLTVDVHDGAAWLECPAFARPTRLPAGLASVAREFFHDRRRIAGLPVSATSATAPGYDPHRLDLALFRARS